MTTLVEILRAGIKAQNGYETDAGDFYMGSTGVVDVDQLVAAVTAAGLAVIQLPTVAFKGPRDTDASLLRGAARKAETGYPVGGSNVGRAVAEILLQAAAAAEAVSA
jgi:hypothetical protein